MRNPLNIWFIGVFTLSQQADNVISSPTTTIVDRRAKLDGKTLPSIKFEVCDKFLCRGMKTLAAQQPDTTGSWVRLISCNTSIHVEDIFMYSHTYTYKSCISKIFSCIYIYVYVLALGRSSLHVSCILSSYLQYVPLVVFIIISNSFYTPPPFSSISREMRPCMTFHIRTSMSCP